jgi:hypothetical protein
MIKSMAWLFASIFGLLFITNFAQADSRQLLSSFRDWEAFVLQTDDGEKICYMISVPKTKTPSDLRHGNPFVTITHKPARKISNEVNFIVGYTFQNASLVQISIDNTKLPDLFTEGDGAWGYDSKQDNAMVTSMKRGTNLVLKGKSGRGNDTSYRFSLSGFTAAHNAITKACR